MTVCGKFQTNNNFSAQFSVARFRDQCHQRLRKVCFQNNKDESKKIGLFVYCTWLTSLFLIVDHSCALFILAIVTIFEWTTITINLIPVTFDLMRHDLQV